MRRCVKAGARDTRSGRTAYGGLRPTDASATSIGLIVLNVAVWIGILATGGFNGRVFDLLALRPKGLCETTAGVYEASGMTCSFGGQLIPGVSDGAYWQVVTTMFTHVAVWHIAFNMMALWVLGPADRAGDRPGPLPGPLLHLGSRGVGAGAGGRAAVRRDAGASGAIFGLMGALLVLAYKVGGDVRGVLTWIGINFLITFVFVNNISWQGHVGGFLGGLACAAVVIYAPRGPRRARVQVAGLACIAALVLVAIVARTLMLSD